MKKDIYDLLNDSITNLEDYEKQELTELEEVRMKKYVQNKTMKKSTMRSSAVAVAAVALLTVGSIGGVASASLENPTAYKIASFIGVNKNLEAYETVVGQSVTKDDITITLKEVILDGNELWLSVVTSSPVYTSDQITGPGARVHINGEEVNGGSSWTTTKLDDNTVQSVIKMPLNKEYNDNIDVKLQLVTPIDGDITTKSPHWNFEFQANGDELLAKTEKTAINETIKLPNGANLTLTNLVENDLQTTIEYHIDSSFENQFVDVVISDEDSNKAIFTLNGTINTDGKFILMQGNIKKHAQELTVSVVVNNTQVSESIVVVK